MSSPAFPPLRLVLNAVRCHRYKVDFAELTSVDDDDEDEFYDSDDSGKHSLLVQAMARC